MNKPYIVESYGFRAEVTITDDRRFHEEAEIVLQFPTRIPWLARRIVLNVAQVNALRAICGQILGSIQHEP